MLHIKSEQMKNLKITLIMFFSLLCGISNAQTGIIINSGATLKGNNAYIKINNGDFINNSSDILLNSTVVFTGNTDQTIGGTSSSSFSALDVNNASAVNLENSLYILDGLVLSDGVLEINNQNLTLSSTSSIDGTFSSSSMINLNGTGQLIKEIEFDDDILFPIGSNTDYSPVEMLFNSGTYGSGAYYSIDVINNKHPNNTSTTDYLNRYWTITSAGITDFSCDAVFQYINGDIIGSESNIYGGFWNNTNWTMLGQASGFSFAGTLSEFGDYTGAQEDMFVGVRNIGIEEINVNFNNGIIQISSGDNVNLSHVEFYNSIGQLILSKDLNIKGTQEFSFNQSSGYYLIKIYTEHASVVKKLIL